VNARAADVRQLVPHLVTAAMELNVAERKTGTPGAEAEYTAAEAQLIRASLAVAERVRDVAPGDIPKGWRP